MFDRTEFQKDFDRSKKLHKIMFRVIFTIVIIGFIGYFAVIGFAGKAAYDKVQDNGGNVGEAIGSFVSDIQRGMDKNK